MKFNKKLLAAAMAATLVSGNVSAFTLPQNVGSLTTSTNLAVPVMYTIIAINFQVLAALHPYLGGFAMRTSSVDTGASSGQAAGDGFGSMTPWASTTSSSSDSLYATNGFHTDSWSAMVGADMMLSDSMVAGITIGFENADSKDTKFGGNAFMEVDGVTIAPYWGMNINENFSVDASLGFTSLETNAFFDSGAGSTAKFDSDRWFAAANVNYFRMLSDKLELSSRLGVMWSEETIDRYTYTNGAVTSPETKIAVTQVQFGITATYVGESLAPYFSVTYNQDIDTKNVAFVPTAGSINPANETQDVVLAFGASWYPTDDISAGFEVSKRTGRLTLKESVVSANLRVSL